MKKSLYLLVLALFLAACSASPAAQTTAPGNIAMAPMDGMPAEVKAAPVTVRQAYQYAVANPQTLQEIPCYCGCGPMGHKSNYACYVESVSDTGRVNYDPHALGCSICVDITQDVMRLESQGESLANIRIYIDSTYAQYGPSNMP